MAIYFTYDLRHNKSWCELSYERIVKIELDVQSKQEVKGKNAGETDGNQNVTTLILGLALGLLVTAGVVSILIKVIKDKIIKDNTEIEEDNENYGNLDPEQYYEEDKKSEVVHSNDYYK